MANYNSAYTGAQIDAAITAVVNKANDDAVVLGIETVGLYFLCCIANNTHPQQIGGYRAMAQEVPVASGVGVVPALA